MDQEPVVLSQLEKLGGITLACQDLIKKGAEGISTRNNGCDFTSKFHPHHWTIFRTGFFRGSKRAGIKAIKLETEKDWLAQNIYKGVFSGLLEQITLIDKYKYHWCLHEH